MGERVSIQFDHQGELSCVVFSQDAGAWLIDEATTFADRLTEQVVERNNDGHTPLDRFDVDVVLLAFLKDHLAGVSTLFGSGLRLLPPDHTGWASETRPSSGRIAINRIAIKGMAGPHMTKSSEM